MRWPYALRKKEGHPMRIPHLAGAIYKWDCIAENWYIKHARLPDSGIYSGNHGDRSEKVIVSLTTFPARIGACYFAIKSLMLQTYPADRIILWLAETQFPDHRLPDQYQELIQRGLEIQYCDDLKSHKKYYYSLQQQRPDEVVITFDDDIIYEGDAIEKLMSKHSQYPECVICNRGHHITTQNGEIAPYKKWPVCSSEGVYEPSIRILMSTGAGCLYPYGIMPETTFELNLIKEYAPTADDLWMTFNRINAGVPVVKTQKNIAILCNINQSQSEALTIVNDIGNENERTIERLKKLFPHVMERCLEVSGNEQ